ncbi:hypothetical protein F5I97DRAFT_1799357 [Phlebopus sp. FC_14]|nr:hypothetical protein F5I97DRAFT_1799357 [Phlebopus sp. FC_14]
MSLASTSLWISCVWLVIHAFKHSSKRSNPVLPLSQGRRQITDVTVRNLNLRVKTQAFNALHDGLSNFLLSGASRQLRQAFLWFYDLGSFLSAIGMLVALGLLAWTTITLSASVLEQRSATTSGVLSKRGTELLGDSSRTSSSHSFAVNLIIPGVTVPLAHLPMILLALCMSQVVHEAGHAFTAALHRIPILSSGVAITFIVPSAFVVLPTARLDGLFPRDRLRIIGAGCFHNFMFWCLLVFAAWTQIGTLFTSLFFQDVSNQGKMIIGVDHDSPLNAYLPIGTLVTRLDDAKMNVDTEDGRGDPWDEYLLTPSPDLTRGWCVDNSLSLNNSGQLAMPFASCIPNGLHSCFVSFDGSSAQYSLDPVPILAKNTTRCSSNVECTSSTVCLMPRSDEQLLRITVELDFREEEVVLWKGPKREIWEQVEVGDVRPRFSFIPIRLPDVLAHFFEYLKLTNISLYLFNALPLPALDGSQLLVVLLDLAFCTTSRVLDSGDIESQSDGRRISTNVRTARALKTFLTTSTILLLSLCSLLGIIKSITE